jgi:hypothetical protein
MVTRAHVASRSPDSPLAIVDLSMPPAVEPFEIAGVTRIDLAEIERATATHRQRREGEIPRVDAYIAVPLDQLKSGDLPFDGASADFLRRLFALDDANLRALRSQQREREPVLRGSAGEAES